MIRPLIQELQVKANEELNENVDCIQENINDIKEWLKQHPYLTVKDVNDQWLVSFLRGCKYDLARTKEKIENFYKAKAYYPHFMIFEDPSSARFQRILDHNVLTVLPQAENLLEARTILLNFKNFNQDIMDIDDIMGLLFMQLSILMMEDDNYVVSGCGCLIDGEHLPYRALLKVTPNYLKSFIFCLVKSFPIRIKAITFVNMNPIMEILYRIFHMLLPKKIKDRVSIVSKRNIENISTFISPLVLPAEYGGDSSIDKETNREWLKKIENYAEWLKDEAIYYKC